MKLERTSEQDIVDLTGSLNSEADVTRHGPAVRQAVAGLVRYLRILGGSYME